MISDNDTKIDDINTLRNGNSTITQDFSESTYSNIIFFYIQGRKHVVVVENGETLVSIEMKKKRVTEIDVPPCGSSRKIVAI